MEAQNQVLDQRASSLSNTIAALDAQISRTQMKLATSETNNAFLDTNCNGRLPKGTNWKASSTTWPWCARRSTNCGTTCSSRNGSLGCAHGIDPTKPMKGGQLLMQRSPPATKAAPAAGSPLYNLNVEVGSDGSVHVIPPPTNAPAATNPPSH